MSDTVLSFNVVESICGYKIDELVLFAQMCRRHGISNDELHDFCVGVENGYKCGFDDFCRTGEKMLHEVEKRYGKAVTDDS